jgi:hypothetical protein
MGWCPKKKKWPGHIVRLRGRDEFKERVGGEEDEKKERGHGGVDVPWPGHIEREKGWCKVEREE